MWNSQWPMLCSASPLRYNRIHMNEGIQTYNQTQSPNDVPIVELLAQEITRQLVGAEQKVWHGAPVWFLDGNPIVGYSRRKAGINLMFWSGQSFGEPELKPEGSFKAAEIVYRDVSDINIDDLSRWIEKSARIQWDYKDIVKRKGRLLPLQEGGDR